MGNRITPKENSSITLIGLGPGDSGMLTREAWIWLEGIDKLFLRTSMHPAVSGLPEHLELHSFDDVYEREATFEKVYEVIVETILAKGNSVGGVTYAVPGHPFVAEATCPEIVKRAQANGITVRVIDGVSFLEPTFRALGIDPFPDLILTDAVRLSLDQTPGFPPSSPGLIAQIYSQSIASDVKLTLMTAYPDDHLVKLVHAAGTDDERVEDLQLYEVDHSQYIGLLSSLYVPPLSPQASFESFQEVIARLRGPGGCPWDQEQTHLSLRPFLLEETYEALDALDRDDMDDLQEELGDLLLQIVLHSQIATEEGDFNIHDVLDGIGSKLIRRHPHVFSDVNVDGVSGVTRNWEAIKAEERQENGPSVKKGLLDGIPQALPALSQAEEIIERVGRLDFDKLETMGDLGYIQKILSLLRNRAMNADLIGHLLFAIASLAHDAGIDAESSLREVLARFRDFFSEVEAIAAQADKPLMNFNESEIKRLWQQFTAELDQEGEG